MNPKLNTKNTPAELHPYLFELNELYLIYLRVMEFKRDRDLLNTRQLAGAWIYVGYGYLRDVLFNAFTATRIFRDMPHEFTFTARLKRYRKGNDKKKQTIAEFLCDSVLDQGDPDGDHC